MLRDLVFHTIAPSENLIELPSWA